MVPRELLQHLAHRLLRIFLHEWECKSLCSEHTQLWPWRLQKEGQPHCGNAVLLERRN